MNTLAFYTILTGILSFAGLPKIEPSGICVISILFKASKAQPAISVTPNDSLFFKGNYIVEKLLGLQNNQVNGSDLLSVTNNGFNIIDMRNRNFVKLNNYNEFKLLSIKNFKPLKEKKYGFLPYTTYYNKEQYKSCKILINKKLVKKIVFQSYDDVTKENVINTVIIDETIPKSFPCINYNLENNFPGKIISIQTDYPTGKSLIINAEYLQSLKKKDFILFDFLHTQKR